MPVKVTRVKQAPAEIRFEQPEGPEVVGSDKPVLESTGFHEKNPGNDVVEATWHAPDQTGMPVPFEQPGPQVVQLEGWDFTEDEDVEEPTDEVEETKPSVKIVTPPKGVTAPSSSTPGAVTK